MEYTPTETAVWGQVLRELRGLYPAHACAEFLRCFPLFNFREGEVPQVCVQQDCSMCARREVACVISLHPCALPLCAEQGVWPMVGPPRVQAAGLCLRRSQHS